MIETALPGVTILRPIIHTDSRGRFLKTFHAHFFRSIGLSTDFVEQYYSQSTRDVIRGMHFQRPPSDHAKLVYCCAGAILDVVLDLRRDSPSYGRALDRVLSDETGDIIFIPKGCAHGFLALSDHARHGIHMVQ